MRAFKNVYDVMNSWGANHGAIFYGGGRLITLASMLRIPVNIPNVPERIFRPKAVVSLFGTANPLEAADFPRLRHLRSDVPLVPFDSGCPRPTGLTAGHHLIRPRPRR